MSPDLTPELAHLLSVLALGTHPVTGLDPSALREAFRLRFVAVVAATAPAAMELTPEGRAALSVWRIRHPGQVAR